MILPDVRTGTTASLTSIPIIYTWKNLQKTLFLTRPCKIATVTLMSHSLRKIIPAQTCNNLQLDMAKLTNKAAHLGAIG